MLTKEQRDEIMRIASRIEHASTEESEAYELANFHKYLDSITVPEGWQVVPVEPTDEMLEAADEAYTRGYSGTATAHPASVYSKMLAAAPTPPVVLPPLPPHPRDSWVLWDADEKRVIEDYARAALAAYGIVDRQEDAA